MWNLAVNWIGVIAGTLAAMIIGSIWYSPKVFGKIWMKQTKVDMNKAMKGAGAKPMVMALVASFITAFMFGLLILNWQITTVLGAIQLAFLLWFGIVFTYQMVRMAFEGTSWQFFLEECAHHLIVFSVVAALIIVA